MRDRILLSVFFFCLFACATMVLIAIWMGQDNALGETYFKTTATLFIIGFAAFITWFVMQISCLSRKLRG